MPCAGSPSFAQDVSSVLATIAPEAAHSSNSNEEVSDRQCLLHSQGYATEGKDTRTGRGGRMLNVKQVPYKAFGVAEAGFDRDNSVSECAC